MDQLSQNAEDSSVFKVKCNGSEFSLSGVQNKVQDYFAACQNPTETAAFALRCVAGAVIQATKNAKMLYPEAQVVFSGGVASNSLLRKAAEKVDGIFCEPCYSTDNALGVAVLTKRILEG